MFTVNVAKYQLMHSYGVAIGVFWIIVGAFWLRRAWLGARTPLLISLARTKGERDSSAVRVGNALMGIAGIVIGLVYLLQPLFKHGHLR